jgi:hypothetical protein
MDNEWRLHWVGTYGDSEVFIGAFGEVMVEMAKVATSGLMHPDEPFTVTPPAVI